MVRSYIHLIRVFMVFMILSGCTKIALMQGQGPQWVRDGSGSFAAFQGKVFHGVGAARGIQNRMLLRATADNAARDELLRVLENYCQRLMRTSLRASVTEEEIRQHVGLLARLNLRQAVISEHWQAQQEADDRLYALCRLDLAVFKENLVRYKSLNDNLRQTMLDQADDVHRAMAHRP